MNMDTSSHPELINTRFAYVSVSRASHEAQIFINAAAALGQRLSHDASKSSAIDFRQPTHTSDTTTTTQHRKDKPMDIEAQQARRPEETKTRSHLQTGRSRRHYAPLNRELHPEDARQFGWKAENGTIQTYQHAATQRHIHVDGPSGQFYDQQKNPVTQHAALDHAVGVGKHHAPEPAKVQEAAQQKRVDQRIAFGL